MKCFIFALLFITPVTAVVNLRRTDACAAEDLKRRMQLQNRLAGDCDEMCKEVGAYPKKCTCPDFVQPDSTPGVMTWDELLAHMDNLVEWGGPRGLLKQWQSQASSVLQTGLDAKACAALDLKHRSQVQNKLASACLDMCKEIGAYPKCECPGFAPPDATPGVMTWDELNEHMDNLVAWGLDMLKKAKARAGSFIQNKTVADVKNQTTAKKVIQNKTVADVKNQTTAKKVNRGCSLKGTGVTADITQKSTPTAAMGGGSWTFDGPGQVRMTNGKNCLNTGGFDGSPTVAATSGGASDAKTVECGAPCCIEFCCGTTTCFSSR